MKDFSAFSGRPCSSCSTPASMRGDDLGEANEAAQTNAITRCAQPNILVLAFLCLPMTHPPQEAKWPRALYSRGEQITAIRPSCLGRESGRCRRRFRWAIEHPIRISRRLLAFDDNDLFVDGFEFG